MRITLRQMEIFLAIANAGSTTLAATTLSLSQSATSAGLQELESGLGTILFDRLGKRLQLNDQGRQLLPKVRQVLAAASDIEREFRSDGWSNMGSLKIGMSTTIGSYILPSLLADFGAKFKQAFPQTVVANTNEVATAVAEFRLDLGLIEGPAHRSGLHLEPWLIDELVLVCAPGYFEGASRDISLDALAQANWLLREPGSGTREMVAQNLLPHLGNFGSVSEFNSSETIQRAVAKGLGVSCLSTWVVADALSSGLLQQISSPIPKLKRQCFLISARDKHASRSMQQMMDYFRDWQRAF